MALNISKKTGYTAGAGVVLAPVIVWVGALFGIDIPAEVAAALGGLLSLAVAYFVPARSGKYVVPPELVPENWVQEEIGSSLEWDTSDTDFDVKDPEAL